LVSPVEGMMQADIAGADVRLCDPAMIVAGFF
jgi:hypothetical protein